MPDPTKKVSWESMAKKGLKLPQRWACLRQAILSCRGAEQLVRLEQAVVPTTTRRARSPARNRHSSLVLLRWPASVSVAVRTMFHRMYSGPEQKEWEDQGSGVRSQAAQRKAERSCRIVARTNWFRWPRASSPLRSYSGSGSGSLRSQ